MAFGSQWKTRGGWRAMVVVMKSDEVNVLHWHDHDGRAYAVTPHFKTGKSWTAFGSDYYLINPWIELIKSACWVNINAGGQLGGTYIRKDQPDESGNHGQCIARVKVSYTQGQFDE